MLKIAQRYDIIHKEVKNMKKKFATEWLSILLILTFSINTIINIFLYIENQNSFGLFRLILYPFALFPTFLF